MAAGDRGRHGVLGESVLRRVRNQADLFEFLADELGWPLDVADLDEEHLTWEWLPEDLGIDPASLASLRRLRQLRPLTAGQPWGIFFVEFDRERLPVTQFRKVAQAFARRKRDGGADADRARWNRENLLFLVTTGRNETVQMHLLALWDRDGRADEIRSLAWRPAQASVRHLSRLEAELLPRLSWPDDADDGVAWRDQWRDAFKLPLGAAIGSAATLAERMAQTARDLRGQIAEALDAEAHDGGGPFTEMLGLVRSQLIADADAAKFADMCAQTLVYGMLSARVTAPEDFGTSPVYSTVPLSNPFLEALFEQVQDEASVLDLPGSGLDQLVADLKATNVEHVFDQFGTTAKGGDPVIHFYEEFLKQYDRKLRADAGAFYTPQPVVEFVVRAVDEVLRTKFGLPMGIADASPWSAVAERNGFKVPEGIDASSPFVSMIDPATGTGTFLVAWINQAKHSFVAGGGEQAQWPSHLRDRVLPSMHGFELMLGPYAIAHLKVALELHSHGVEDARVNVFLTDTLEHHRGQGQLSTMSDPISAEGEAAATLKSEKRFTVVIGNPPYDREQRAVGDTAKRKGGVVRFETPGVEASPLLQAVTEPMSRAGLGGHLKNVYNDYVYFWRWATWQATELPPAPGVVAFITASSYLDGISMGGLRHHLREAFDELHVVDLGGEGRGALKEENVFDIQTPVAIAIGTSKGPKPKKNPDSKRTPDGSDDSHPAQEVSESGTAGSAESVSSGSAADEPESPGEFGDPPLAAASEPVVADSECVSGGDGDSAEMHAATDEASASHSARVPGSEGDPANGAQSGCEVSYRRIEGDRADKFAGLRRMRLHHGSASVTGDGTDRLTVSSGHDYFDWPEITDLFPWIHSGSQFKRTWPIAEAKSLLDRRWRSMTGAVPRGRAGLLKETRDRKVTSRIAALLEGSEKLRSLRSLDRDDAPEALVRYGYRSFDRQWAIADHRVADYPRPPLWRVRGRRQVFLTTLTSTKLGSGPVLTATPYVPDLDHFSGRGAKNVMPLYRDAAADASNVTDGILEALRAALDTQAADAASNDDPDAEAALPAATPVATATPTAEDMLAYVCGLGGTPAFSERFAKQLAEAAGPVRIPITSDPALFAQAVALGRDLLWWHTWGERFAPQPNAKLPPGRAAEVKPVTGMPDDLKDCRYDPDTEQLTVGTGIFAPVSPEVWNFEVSGLKVLRSWLGYRVKNRKGRKSSDLDDIRPTRWTQSKELLLLLSILEHTIDATPRAADLLDRIVDGPLIPAADLPPPTPAERRPPRS